MSLFDFMIRHDIHQGVTEFHRDPKAFLLDVRSPQEYGGGHIPGSRNIPLQSIDRISSIVENKDAPLFIYCHSGARSRQAASVLKHMGYSNVKNIGGIVSYSGRLER